MNKIKQFLADIENQNPTYEQWVKLALEWSSDFDQLLAERQWVPVSEPPEPFHEVMITDGTNGVNRAHLHSNGMWMSRETFYTRHHPTHWMEIPALPRGPNANE